MTFNDVPTDPLKDLKTAVKNGHVGSFIVDKDSFKEGKT